MGLDSLLGNIIKNVGKDVAKQAKTDLNQKVRTSTQKLKKGVEDGISKGVTKAMMKKEDVTFQKLPQNLDELMVCEGSDLKSPFKTAAFMIAALNVYVNDKENGIKMIDYLNGPENVSTIAVQNYDFKLGDIPYVVRSYFKGAKPENDYTPDVPYVVHVEENPYSYQNEGYCTLYVDCGGADSARQIFMRKKGDQWFIWGDQKQLTMSIRIPHSENKWA